MLLLRDHTDTGDEGLTAALVRYFTEDTEEASQLVVRGPCLAGFSMGEYANPMAAGGTVRAEVTEAIDGWRQRVGTAITNENLTSFELDVFYVPFPSVQSFRDQLLQRLGLGS